MKAGIITGIALAAVAAGGIVTFMLMRSAEVTDPVAEIRVGGETVRRVPLSEDCEFTIECPSGSNTITVADGAVSVTDADCPDRICVRTGAISGGKIPIICLPHQLEIIVVSGNSADDADDAAY